MSEKDIIDLYAKELKLASLRENVSLFAEDAIREQWGYLAFLRRLLEEEVTRRREKSKITRIHRADFPQMKYLEELHREELPLEGQMLLPEVENLEFIKEGRSIVMYGNPGTGKTHISIGLGIKACLEGYSVFFTSVPHLLTNDQGGKDGKAPAKPGD
jgi:DNA replication protein DnaC